MGFARGLLAQTGEGLPGWWGIYQGKPVPAGYGMSITGPSNPASVSVLAKALRSLPSVCLDTDPENLFHDTTGIYLHSDARGHAWERPVSLRFVDPATREHFEVHCGLRIHGGTSRRPEESPKHSFRLVFHERYGAASLRFPLFAPPGPREFSSLVLRAGVNDSWLDSNGPQRARALYLRDEWMRRTMLAMGHGAVRGIFVHLYLNGLYWGVYNLCERPGSGPVSDPTPGYDFIKDGQLASGDRAAFEKLMSLAHSSLLDKDAYREIAALLDLTEFADYIILNVYAGNTDWGHDSNWYAIRSREDGGKFQFFVWDAERTLGDADSDPLAVNEEGSPLDLFHKLSMNPAFQALVADRVHRLFSERGPLAPANCSLRLTSLARTIEQALRAEAARWGTYRAVAHQFKSGPFDVYAVSTHWCPEVQRIQNGYFLERQKYLFTEFKQRGLISGEQSALFDFAERGIHSK